MNLLLDTHVLLWYCLDDPKLPRDIARRIESAESTSWVSPVSIWESLLLAERGRLALPAPAMEWLSRELAGGPFREAPLTWEIAIESRRLALTHEDPADRFLAATARVNGFTFVTGDARLKALKGVEILAVSARKR